MLVNVSSERLFELAIKMAEICADFQELHDRELYARVREKFFDTHLLLTSAYLSMSYLMVLEV